MEIDNSKNYFSLLGIVLFLLIVPGAAFYSLNLLSEIRAFNRDLLATSQDAVTESKVVAERASELSQRAESAERTLASVEAEIVENRALAYSAQARIKAAERAAVEAKSALKQSAALQQRAQLAEQDLLDLTAAIRADEKLAHAARLKIEAVEKAKLHARTTAKEAIALQKEAHLAEQKLDELNAAIDADAELADAARLKIAAVERVEMEVRTSAEQTAKMRHQAEFADRKIRELKATIETDNELIRVAQLKIDAALLIESEAQTTAEQVAFLQDRARLADQKIRELNAAIGADQELVRVAQSKIKAAERMESKAREVAEEAAILRQKAELAEQRLVAAKASLATEQALILAAQSIIDAAAKSEAKSEAVTAEAASLQMRAREADQYINAVEAPIADDISLPIASATINADTRLGGNSPGATPATDEGASDPQQTSSNDIIEEQSEVPYQKTELIGVSEASRLFLSLDQGNFGPIAAYLAASGNPNVINTGGGTLLSKAAWKGQHDYVDRLLQAGADVNLADRRGRTPLINASIAGHRASVQHIVGAGADIDIAAADGKTALMAASINDHFEIASTLVSEGANINAIDRSGRSALFFAIWEGHEDIANLLITNGADIDLVDLEGKTLVQLAEERGLELF